ncbi:MAG: hypothetical protein GDA41_04810 [Rhodospirillales bacterium]|nr:hypothetical protein [Rhodospirillales bacterium]
MAPAGQDLTSLTLEGEGSIVLKRHPRAKRLMVLAATQIDGPAGRTAALALTMLPLERRFELLYQERGALDVDLQQIPLAATISLLMELFAAVDLRNANEGKADGGAFGSTNGA